MCILVLTLALLPAFANIAAGSQSVEFLLILCELYYRMEHEGPTYFLGAAYRSTRTNYAS